MQYWPCTYINYCISAQRPFRHSDSNHWQFGCLFNILFRLTTMKIFKQRITGPLCHTAPVIQKEIPCQNVFMPMMTSSNGKGSRVTGPLWGESTRDGVRYKRWYLGTGTGTWELARYRYRYRYMIFQKYLGTSTGTHEKYLGTGTGILYDGVTKNQTCFQILIPGVYLSIHSDLQEISCKSECKKLTFAQPLQSTLFLCSPICLFKPM